MARIAVGDGAHLSYLFERHHLSLYRYLVNLTGNRALSEDLAQEAFLRVLKHAYTYNPRLTFSVWLFGIARKGSEPHVRRSPIPWA